MTFYDFQIPLIKSNRGKNSLQFFMFVLTLTLWIKIAKCLLKKQRCIQLYKLTSFPSFALVCKRLERGERGENGWQVTHWQGRLYVGHISSNDLSIKQLPSQALPRLGIMVSSFYRHEKASAIAIFHSWITLWRRPLQLTNCIFVLALLLVESVLQHTVGLPELSRSKVFPSAQFLFLHAFLIL